MKVYNPSDFSRSLFEAIDRRIKNLSPEVTQSFNKKYVAYKLDGTNFTDVIVQKQKLRLIINLKFKEVIDPKGICRDVANIGKWGNGDIEVSFENLSQLEDVMEIIIQSFNKQSE